jgi:hypothetical protein
MQASLSSRGLLRDLLRDPGFNAPNLAIDSRGHALRGAQTPSDLANVLGGDPKFSCQPAVYPVIVRGVLKLWRDSVALWSRLAFKIQTETSIE